MSNNEDFPTDGTGEHPPEEPEKKARGRPKGSGTKTDIINARVPVETKERLQAFAEARGMTGSQVIVQAVKWILENNRLPGEGGAALVPVTTTYAAPPPAPPPVIVPPPVVVAGVTREDLAELAVLLIATRKRELLDTPQATQLVEEVFLSGALRKEVDE